MASIARNRLLSLISPIVLLAVWELAVAVGWLNRIFYPPPSETLVSLGRLAASGELASDVAISSVRVGLGFILGAVPAVAIGLLMGISAAANALVRPLAAAIYPIPKIALLPLVIVALGLGEASKVATIALSVFFLVVLNVAASVAQVDQRYFEVARSFGARGRALFWTVALPGSLPGSMSGLKLGMGFALTLIIGVEFVGANEGIGQLIWQSYEIYAIDRMLAGLVTIALLGWLVTLLLDELERFLVPWQAQSARAVRRSSVSAGHLQAGRAAKPGGSEVVYRTVAAQQARSDNEAVMKSWFQIWWPTFRPWSYTAALIPVALGSAIAAYHGAFDPLLFILALAGSILIQAGTNLANEFYDDRKGLDKIQQYGIGGALQRGDLQPHQVLAAAIICFALGSAVGLYLVSVTGPFIFWLGLISVACGFFYTAGPFTLAYNGLGEIAVFIFMGPVMVVGAYYVQAQAVTLPVVLASLPVGFLVAAILHANNLRDIDVDRQVGKRTLATLLGRRGARREYYVLIGGTYLSSLAIVALGIAPWWTLITMLTLPLAARLIRIASRESEARALQPVLRQTAKLHAQFGVLLVAGWVAALAIAG
jgi:1,4-dihydroxy-2-naphthoate octaprenyltransferase